MILPLPTHGKSWRFRVGIRSFEPVNLLVRGIDAHEAHSSYFVRNVPISPSIMRDAGGYREFSLPMPLSPELLLLHIEPVDQDENIVRLEKFEVEPLEVPPLVAFPQVHRFIKFAEGFAQDAGWLPTGTYESPNEEFRIEYLPVIRDVFGQVLLTPARIHRTTKRIQASQHHIRKYTIPIRVFIFIHEWMHAHLNTRDEEEADRHALLHYLDLMYPEIEGIYSGTKVMNAKTPQARKVKRDRVKNLYETTLECRNQQSLGGACTVL